MTAVDLAPQRFPSTKARQAAFASELSALLCGLSLRDCVQEGSRQAARQDAVGPKDY